MPNQFQISISDCTKIFQAVYIKGESIKQKGFVKFLQLKSRKLLNVYLPSLIFCCVLKSVQYLQVYICEKNVGLVFKQFKFNEHGNIKQTLDSKEYTNKDRHNSLGVCAGRHGPEDYKVEGKFWRNYP